MSRKLPNNEVKKNHTIRASDIDWIKIKKNYKASKSKLCFSHWILFKLLS